VHLGTFPKIIVLNIFYPTILTYIFKP